MKETVNTEKDNANRLEIFENQDYIERKEKKTLNIEKDRANIFEIFEL